MGLWSKTARLLQWLRESFERFAPPASAVLPWVGGLMLVIAVGFGVHSWRFARERVRANATITENVSGFAKQGGVVYTPRFRFRTAGGELVLVLAKSGSDEIEFPAGETVPVLYRAGDPQGAVIATAWLAYEGAIVFGVLGVALFDVGWALRLMLRARVTASA
jgi:Protein of unknown function (DUF3592)